MNPDWTDPTPKNVTLTFENGYQLSIAYGGMAYGNGSARIENGALIVKGTVETAIFGPDDAMVEDDVRGWQTAEDVQATVLYVKGLVYEVDEDD